MPLILYLDCFCGCSGDMLLATMLDLGYDSKNLKTHLDKLSVKGLAFKTLDVKRNGQYAKQLIPVLTNHQHHRSFSDIKSIITKSSLSEIIKNNSIACLKTLGMAEAKIHHTSLNQVHFHEIGALDTILDIVGFCSAVHEMKIDKIVVSPINVGSGTIKCSHGILPVPAPATSSLLINFPVFSSGPKTELATPTAAAIINHFATPSDLIPPGILRAIGLGAGKKVFKTFPNFLRGFLLESSCNKKNAFDNDKIVILKSNIDDQSPELISHVQHILIKSNALDVSVVPILMKKNRLGMQLEVICNREDVYDLSKIILTQTSAIGLRIEEVNRIKLKRSFEKIEYKGIPIRVKHSYWGNRLIKSKAESDDMQKAAKKLNLPFKEISKELTKMLKITNKKH